MPNVEPIRRKSMYWWRHGKHAKIDPALTDREHPRSQRTEPMFPSVLEAFAAARRGRR